MRERGLVVWARHNDVRNGRTGIYIVNKLASVASSQQQYFVILRASLRIQNLAFRLSRMSSRSCESSRTQVDKLGFWAQALHNRWMDVDSAVVALVSSLDLPEVRKGSSGALRTLKMLTCQRAVGRESGSPMSRGRVDRSPSLEIVRKGTRRWRHVRRLNASKPLVIDNEALSNLDLSSTSCASTSTRRHRLQY
jgi:hypothetical protein